VVEGHGDAHPLAPNDSAENRSANRRVEMTIQQGQDSRPKLEEPTAALKVPTSVEVLSHSAAMISTANFAEPTPIVESPQTPNQ
jgi:hypothetical protein